MKGLIWVFMAPMAMPANMAFNIETKQFIDLNMTWLWHRSNQAAKKVRIIQITMAMVLSSGHTALILMPLILLISGQSEIHLFTETDWIYQLPKSPTAIQPEEHLLSLW